MATKKDLLYSASGSHIETFGETSLTLDHDLRRSFPWIFTIAQVKTLILVADFLSHFGLIVNMSSRSLVNQTTEFTMKYTTTRISAALPAANGLQESLKKYPEIITPFKCMDPVRHNAEHKILHLHVAYVHISTSFQSLIPAYAGPSFYLFLYSTFDRIQYIPFFFIANTFIFFLYSSSLHRFISVLSFLISFIFFTSLSLCLSVSLSLSLSLSLCLSLSVSLSLSLSLSLALSLNRELNFDEAAENFSDQVCTKINLIVYQEAENVCPSRGSLQT
ncbi:unnamed protein product [Acanthosepion pharaonis]|uniref:Uncharacterized protein n=1 Tax=Acanthosepion pharaonis TaxID=158019 RepID=A0A812AKP1_ACAPH|nr:unnamed protein product [Sepia pharaonis]